MTTTRKRHIAPVVVLAGALAGAGAAYAATKLHGSSPAEAVSAGTLIASGVRDGDHGPGGRHARGDDFSAAADYLGVTQSALITQLRAGKTLAQIADATSGKSAAGLVAALVAAEKTELAAAVTAGRITQAQADQMNADLTARFTAVVNGTEPEHHPGGGGFGHARGGDELTAAASYLGVTENALITQVQSGKTLAQIADATSGKSAAGLVIALVAAEKTELTAAVTAGRITQAQADQLSTTLQARFQALVNGTRPAPDHAFGSREPSGTHL